MKKFSKKCLKFLSLTVAIVMLVATLASCSAGISKKISSFDKILNSAYVTGSNSYNGAVEIKDVKGAELAACNEEIAVFKAVAEDGITTYTVYSFREQKVVRTFTSSVTVAHTVELFADAPAFFVEQTTKKAVVINPAEGEESTEPVQTVYDTDITYTLYDFKGGEVKTKTKDVGRPIAFADMLIYSSSVYTVQADGTLKESDTALPENLYLSACDSWNDEYLYVFDDENGFSISVFDRKFNPVAFWEAPAVALESGFGVSHFVLDSGNVLIQYAKKLSTDTEKYDIYDYAKDGTVLKYDLVSLLFTPDTSKEKELKLDFIVADLESSTEIKRDADEASKYTDKINNFAYIHPIVDGKVDYSQSATDLVLMDGKANIKGSVKLADQQTASMPVYIAENLYCVDTFYGFALVDAKGELITPVNNSAMTANNNYIIGKSAIYNYGFEVIYNLDKENASVMGNTENAVFVFVGNSQNYKILRIYDNKSHEIYSSDNTNNIGAEVAVLKDINCFALVNNVSKNYSYYNEKGDEIIKTTSPLSVVSQSDKLNTCLLQAEDGNYYLFGQKAQAN